MAVVKEEEEEEDFVVVGAPVVAVDEEEEVGINNVPSHPLIVVDTIAIDAARSNSSTVPERILLLFVFVFVFVLV